MHTIVREDFTFFHPLRVRWSEVDPQGIVFNPNYLAYADIALTEYMRGIGFPYPDGLLKLGSDLFAVRAEINFRASAKYDDELDLAARISRIGRTSFNLTVGVFRGEQVLCEVLLVYVNAAPETQRPMPLPAPVVDAVMAFETRPPERASAAGVS
jgi:acyl-CoA thioester hydrolase